MSVQVSYKKQFALGIMLLLVTLVVVEGLANVWWYQLNACAFEDNELFEDLNEEEKRQLCIDNLDLQVTEKGIEPNQKSSSIHINSDGFRGPEITQEKPEGTYRIFLVGGSTTFGSGVRDDETPSAHLQKFFDESELDFKVEVINAGIPAAWSKGEVKFLKERLVKYEPDLFIIYDGGNDLAHANEPQEGPIIWKERWLEICNLGKETGFDTIITIQPFLGTGKRIPTDQEKTYGSIINTGNSGTYQLFVEQLKELNIFCAATSDLRGIFDNVSSTIFFDVVHVNSHGNKIVAEAFYEKSLPIVLKKSNDMTNANEDVFKYQEKIDDDTSNIKNNLKLDDSVNTLRKFFLSYKTPRVMLNLLTVFSYEKPQQTIFDQKENEIQKQPLIGINFNGEDLSGLDFSNSDLENIIFYRANLTNVNFENSNLAGADFRFADITGINFQNAKMQGVNLSHLDLRDVDLSGLDLSNVNLSYVNLSGSNLTNSILINANLEEVNLENAMLTNIDLSAANMYNANLRYAIFTDSDLTLVNLENADISNGEFHTTIMQATILTNANLTNAKINDSDLFAANLHGVILEGTVIEQTRLVCFNNPICD